MANSYVKYENYIRIGHNGSGSPETGYTCSDLKDFPTPSVLERTLHDQDKDPFTDLQGYTHRNRVRKGVEDITITYNVLSEEDISYILNRLEPEWIYVELLNKATKKKEVHKMYASDKKFNTLKIWKDERGEWHEMSTAFSFSLVEE